MAMVSDDDETLGDHLTVEVSQLFSFLFPHDLIIYGFKYLTFRFL